MTRPETSEPAASSTPRNPSVQTAVLLVNLGTPAAPTANAVRRYLAQFLSDPRVIETPRWLWLPILYGVILRIRPARSARAYASIWTAEGSPLLVYSRGLTNKLQAAFARDGIRVELAMTYGEPALSLAIARLQAEGIRRLLIVPLYPQYSASSTGSVFDVATRALQKLRWPPELRFVADYHADAAYINALAASVQTYWQQHERPQRLLLSFHGLPQRYVDAGDPYLEQCRTTAELLRQRLGLSADEFMLSFQSRVGPAAWLMPYTEAVLDRWPGEGVRRIQVLCPGFAVDCLETLEEIAIRNRERFIAAGGESLDYIPALNDSDAHVDVLERLTRRHLQGWPESVPSLSEAEGMSAESARAGN